MNTSKPGIKSTEFWMAMGIHVLALLAVIAQVLPPEKGAIVMTVVQTGYAIARGLSKHGANELGVPPDTAKK